MTAVTAALRSTWVNMPAWTLGRARPTYIPHQAARLSYSYFSPVLLVAATPLAVAAVSGLAKRPRSGLALTRWTRPRSSCSEEDEP